jgi:tetratricopeptide (TPR) repeat protein
VLARINIYRKRYDLALGHIDRALEINPNDGRQLSYAGKCFGVGRQSPARPQPGSKQGSASTAPMPAQLGTCALRIISFRYGEAVEACDRALARNPSRNIQMMACPVLAAAYSQLGRDQDAAGERAIVARLWPFFDAESFAG